MGDPKDQVTDLMQVLFDSVEAARAERKRRRLGDEQDRAEIMEMFE